MRGLPPPTLVLNRPAYPWLAATVVLLVDATTKFIAESHWTEQGPSLGPLHFHVTSNAGVSFSWLSSAPLVGVIAVSLAVAGILAGALLSREGWPALGFGFILGGAVGNIADRVGGPVHHVVDFIGVGNFFVCNVADIAITIGVIVLGVVLLRGQSVTR